MKLDAKNAYVWLITGEGLMRMDVYYNCDSVVLLNKSASLVYYCPRLSVDIVATHPYTGDTLLRMGFEKVEFGIHVDELGR